MGKYIIELENDQIIDGHITCPMQIGYRDRPSFIIDTGIDITPYTEPDMEKVRKEACKEGREAGIKDGMCDAWEAARKIYLDVDKGGLSANALTIIFGSRSTTQIFKELSASEAIEKIRQYEQEKEEQIQVGDEVEDGVANLIVLEINRDGTVSGFDNEGSIIHATPRKKTGRHFPEIAEVLQKMKKS